VGDASSGFGAPCTLAGMRRGLLLPLLSLLVVLVALPAGRVAAHAALTGSAPADGAVVTDPLREVTLTFSERVEPTVNGFTIAVDGGAVEPVVTTTDGATWTLSFESINSGAVAVTYDVVSVDGHLITGELSFTVDAPAVASTAAPPAASAPPVPAAATAAPPPASAPPVTAAATSPASANSAALAAPTTVAAEADDDSSDTVLWVIVIAGGVALLGVLGWGAARRSQP
jgi:methionine-rich copper-binding protein CopC